MGKVHPPVGGPVIRRKAFIGDPAEQVQKRKDGAGNFTPTAESRRTRPGYKKPTKSKGGSK